MEPEVERHKMVFVALACKLEASRLEEHHKTRLELVVVPHKMKLEEENKLELVEEADELEQAEEVDKLAELEAEVVAGTMA